MATLSVPKKILLIRLDRIGDLVLTLPVDEAFKNTQIDWWIPQGLDFIGALAQPPRRAHGLPKRIAFLKFVSILSEVRRNRYDAAVIFHAPWWVSLLLWLARIPIRAGVRSQWHSFLFLNRTVRQKRSRAEFSELEYNFRLVEALGLTDTSSLARSSLKLRSEAERELLLRRHSLKPGTYNVVHPGMGGSALNWPSENYAELIRALLKQGEPVVITGTATDAEFLAPLRAHLILAKDVIWLDGKLSGRELVTLLGAAKAVFAPSTGVLHLAASCDVPTIGIFSPVRVQHPKRWGPQGSKTAVLLPADVECPGEMNCLGENCKFYDCMSKISALSALQERDRLLNS